VELLLHFGSVGDDSRRVNNYLIDRETLNRVEIAGLAHDMARELSPGLIRTIAGYDDIPVLSEEEINPILLHGRAAAVLMKQEWGVKDEVLLQAVRWHTTGEVGMGKLGMLLLLADYLEPGRQHIDENFRSRVLGRGELTDMMMVVLEDQCEYNTKKGRKISERTESLITALREDRCAVVQTG